MTIWLNPNPLVLTRSVNERVANDINFAKFVSKSIRRFNQGDWGNIDAEDWQANDRNLQSLNDGGWYGQILGNYAEFSEKLDGLGVMRGSYHIWVIRNTALEDGTQTITVLFPEEY